LHTTRPTLEVLEDRALPSGFSSIQARFNGTPINAGETIWFNSEVKVSGLGATPATIHLGNSAIDFTVNGASYHLNVPGADVTFSPSATSATTAFDNSNNLWETTVPSTATSNAFLAGLALPVTTSMPGVIPLLGGGLLGGLLSPLTSALPGSITPTWSGTFQADTPDLTVTWQWSAAVYTQLGSDYNSLGVKPVDGNQLGAYHNMDLAGTPENFRAYLAAGARSSGGSNYTGTASGTAQVVPDYVPPPPPPPPPSATLSGAVVDETTGAGLSGVTITLSWLDASGQQHSLSTSTDAHGNYTFTGLGAATYTITENISGAYLDDPAANQVGSLGGSTSMNTFSGIVVHSGDNGVNYLFSDAPQS
jgi:hypothetical protein